MAQEATKKKRRGACGCCTSAPDVDEVDSEDAVVVEAQGDAQSPPGEAEGVSVGSLSELPNGGDATGTEEMSATSASGGPEKGIFSTIDRLFSVRSRSNSVLSEEAQETQKLQKSSRQYLLIMGVLMFQVGFIYIAIAFVRTVSNLVEDMKSDATPAGMKEVALVYTLDVIGECLLGYIFVTFSKTMSKIALTPGRDVTGLATMELASLFHKFRFVLVFICLWTTYDAFAVPLLRNGAPSILHTSLPAVKKFLSSFEL